MAQPDDEMKWLRLNKDITEPYRKRLEQQEYFTQLWITRFNELEEKFKAVCHENNKLRQKLYPLK